MLGPCPVPTFTQTPNILIDEWLPLLGHVELKVLMVIIRKTFGWHKIRDQISLSQLVKITGSNKTNVIKATTRLQELGLIRKEVEGTTGSKKTSYELVTQDSNNLDRYQPSTTPGTTVVHTKETKQNKEESTLARAKEIADNPKPSARVPRATHVFTSFQEHKNLVKDFGVTTTARAYERLSEWKLDTPKAKWKKNDYLAIRRWVIDALKEQDEKAKKASKTPQDKLKEVHEYIRSHVKKEVLAEAKKRNFISIEKDHIAILGTQHAPIIGFTDKGAEEQIDNLIRKLEGRLKT